MINDDIISAQTELSSGVADADEMLISDSGAVKKVGMDTLKISRMRVIVIMVLIR